MASSPPQYVNGLAQILPIEEETPFSTPKFLRTPSFSSSSLSHSWDSSFESSPFSLNEESPPYNPFSTPLKFKGIPFSWEQTPGIPKNHQGFKKKEISGHLLPLPPAGNSSSTTKKWHNQEEISPKKHQIRFQRDPFFAALVECSKDDHDHGTNIWKGSFKITRTLSDRFGFINMYTSCKTTCAVSESIAYLPRASPQYLLHHSRRRSS